MTLQTTIADIDEEYPVAGVDNNTQGFRDNFSSIKSALSLAEAALTKLENNTVKVATLDEENNPVDNDLQGSSIVNGYYGNFHGLTYITPAISVISTSTTNINIQNGPLQIFTLNAANIIELLPFTFTGWPGNAGTNYYANVRCHFLSNMTEQSVTVDTLDVGKQYTIDSLGNTSQASWNTVADTSGVVYEIGSVFIAKQSGGTGTGTAKQWREVSLHGADNFYNEASFDHLSIKIDPLGAHTVIEAWSYNGGNNVFLKLLGSYASTS